MEKAASVISATQYRESTIMTNDMQWVSAAPMFSEDDAVFRQERCQLRPRPEVTEELQKTQIVDDKSFKTGRRLMPVPFLRRSHIEATDKSEDKPKRRNNKLTVPLRKAGDDVSVWQSLREIEENRTVNITTHSSAT